MSLAATALDRIPQTRATVVENLLRHLPTDAACHRDEPGEPDRARIGSQRSQEGWTRRCPCPWHQTAAPQRPCFAGDLAKKQALTYDPLLAVANDELGTDLRFGDSIFGVEHGAGTRERIQAWLGSLDDWNLAGTCAAGGNGEVPEC